MKRLVAYARSQRSQGLTEFAIIAPVILLLTFGIIDFGRALYLYITLQQAANEGARVAVSATGAAHGGSPTENIAYLTVRYEGSLIGHVHVNWLAPAKVRRTILGGSKKMLIYDDMETSEKLKVYDKGFSIATDPTLQKEYQLMISYRSGDMHAPQLETREGLAVEVENVIRAVNGKEPLVADGVAGWRVVRILEAAQQSIKQGVAVPVSGGPAILPR